MVPDVFSRRGSVMAIMVKSPFLVPVGLAAPTELDDDTMASGHFDNRAVLPSPPCSQPEGVVLNSIFSRRHLSLQAFLPFEYREVVYLNYSIYTKYDINTGHN
ncbi:hypothetical protein EDD85DRAFT_794114 [Armillaria nabsnona]|nr:hypothetical protein EDD85DRAFT_794114 [Armillaria nabsnona]